MRNAGLVLVVLCAAGWVIAQPEERPAKITNSAVWHVSQQFMAAAHAACDNSSSTGEVECLTDQMAKAGAPADAVRVTRELYTESHGEFGVMTGFQDEGPVAFAWITYPLRANTNYGLLLVNGRPLIVNIEDLKLLDRKTMEQSSQFQDLKNQFPKIDVWPGDRDGKSWPNSQTGPKAEYSLSLAIRCSMDATPASAPDWPSSPGISTPKGNFSERHLWG